MKNAKQKRKRKRPRPSDPVAKPDEESKVNVLSEAFSLASLNDAVSGYRESNGDPSTSSSSVSGSSEGFVETGCVQNVVNGKGFRRSKQKRVIAATGTVSTVLGKDYVKASPCPRSGWAKSRGFSNGAVEKEEAEQFLCSMLGNECELGMDVVRDVLCQCGYNVQKALDALLDLSASTFEESRNDRYLDNSGNYNEDIRFLIERKDSFTDRTSDCTSRSSESEVQDSIWSLGNVCRNYAKVLASPNADFPMGARSNESDLAQKVLESLFNISKSPKYEPTTMNWTNVVKKLQSLGPGLDVCPSSVTEPQQDTFAKGEEYHVFRKSAKQHWDSMRSYYQKAAVAFSKGDREHAAYLSEQGRVQTKLAQKADEKASHDIFKARNEEIQDVITIDLHGQHVKKAMQYVKALILVGTYVPSIQTLRVITGCGSHGVGKSKVKQSVTNLMQKEGIEWSEENRGTLLVKLSGYRQFSFMDSDSDAE